MTNTETLLTIDDVQNRLRVSRATVYNLFATGELAKVKIRGRTLVRAVDVASLIARNVSLQDRSEG